MSKEYTKEDCMEHYRRGVADGIEIERNRNETYMPMPAYPLPYEPYKNTWCHCHVCGIDLSKLKSYSCGNAMCPSSNIPKPMLFKD